MNEETKKQLEFHQEKVIEESKEKTWCPKCEKKIAHFLKTDHFIVLECDCGFSMGSPRGK